MKRTLVFFATLLFGLVLYGQKYFDIPAVANSKIKSISGEVISEGTSVRITGHKSTTNTTTGWTTDCYIINNRGKECFIKLDDIKKLDLPETPSTSKELWDIFKVQSDIIENLYKNGFQYDMRKDLENESIDILDYFRDNDMLFEDTYLQDYLQTLIYRIHPVTLGDGRPGTLNVNILKCSDPNAIILPNGTIFLTTGLLGLANSEEELIGALAHEVAHFVLDHQIININKDLQRKKWADFWAAMATVAAAATETYMAYEYDYYPTGDFTYATAVIASTVAYSIAERAGAKYSIEQEKEADEVAGRVMKFLNVDPSALATLLAKMREYCYLNGEYLALTGGGTHPDIDSRIKNLGVPNPNQFKSTEYDIRMSRVLSYNAGVEYYMRHLASCEALVDRNIHCGVATEMDYLLKAAVTRALYDTPGKNQEALDYLLKGKDLNVTPNINLYKHEGITYMRLKQYDKAIAAFMKYEEELRLLDDEVPGKFEEIDWTREMIHKAKHM